MFTANAICTNIAEDWYHRNNILLSVEGPLFFPEKKIAEGIENNCFQRIRKGFGSVFCVCFLGESDPECGCS